MDIQWIYGLIKLIQYRNENKKCFILIGFIITLGFTSYAQKI